MTWRRVLFVCLVLTPVAAFGGVAFFKQPYAVDMHGGGGLLGSSDFDHDGHDDYLVVRSGRIDVSIGNGDLTFDAPVSTTLASLNGAKSFAIGFLNGDLFPDLAVANSADDIVVLLGAGDGTFSQSTSLFLSDNTYAIVIGDFTGDGNSDVFARSAGLLFLFPGNGTGGFGVATTSPTALVAFRDVVAADFNGDTHPDIAAASTSGTLLMFGDGTGAFSWPIQATTADTRKVAAADVNEDGLDDLIARVRTTNGAAQLLVFEQDAGTDSLVPTHSYATAPIGPLVVADMDGDTHADLVVSSDDSANVAIHPGAGDGTFAGAIRHLGAGRGAHLVVGEFSGDSHLDVLMYSSSSPGSDAASLMKGNGDGTLRAARAFAPAGERVAVSEATGDALLDLVSFSHDANGDWVISVIPGTGGGTFGAPILTTTGIDTFTEFAFGDFDGDGELDVLAYNSSNVSDHRTYLGNGDGTFAFAAVIPGSTLTLEVHDFDGDGRDDLVHLDSLQFAIQLSNGDGTFGSEIVTRSVARLFADVNNDGFLDAIGRNVLLLGDGDGTFTPGPSPALPSNTSPLHLVDLNGDGNSDLITSRDGSELGVRLGNGDGTFGPPRVLQFRGDETTALSGPFVSGDVDGDGDVDLISRGNSVFLGDGNGWFDGYFSYRAVLPQSFGVGDFDGNGTMDIAALVEDAVAILLANSGDSLERLLTVNLSSSPNPSDHIVPVTFTVNVVSDGVFWPSGAVLLTIEQSLEGIALWVPGGIATFTKGFLQTGTYSVEATYTRETVFAETSDTLMQNVFRKQGIVLSADPPNSAIAGQPVTFTAQVSPETTGAITFKADGVTMGTAPLSDGVAQFTTSSLALGTHEITAEHPGDATFQPSTSNVLSYHITVGLANGFAITATSTSTTSVAVAWPSVSGATSYDIQRGTTTAGLAVIATVTTAGTYDDTTVSSGVAYLYRVIARNGANQAISAFDVATTIAFTNDPLIAGTTPVRVVHVTQLRTAVNAVRSAAGLAPFNFTNPPVAGDRIRASHLTALRTALTQALTTLGLSITYTDTITPRATKVRAVHWQELRNAVR